MLRHTLRCTDRSRRVPKMGIFDKLFGSSDKPSNTAVIDASEVISSCPHSVLLPRWDAVEDIGKDDRATHYVCEACQQTFSPEEAQALKDTMSERLLEVTAEASEATPTQE
jgi:hypothetical protein